MPASQPSRIALYQSRHPRRARALITVLLAGGAVAASSFHHPFRFDLAVVSVGMALSWLTGSIVVLTSAVTLLLGGHTHWADAGLVPGALLAIAAGRWLLRGPGFHAADLKWAPRRIGCIVGPSFVAALGERLLLHQHAWPSLGQWTFTALSIMGGLFLAAVVTWRPQRTTGTESTFGIALAALGTVSALLFTTMFWSRQDERLLHVTADATSVGLLTSLTENMNVISAKAASSVDIPFSPEAFPEQIQTVVYGHESITSAQLAHIDTHGVVTVTSQLSALGQEFDTSFSNWTQGQAAALQQVQTTGVLTYLGFASFPVPTGGEQPYLIYAVPITENGTMIGSSTMLISAMSLPNLIANAAAPTLAATGEAILSLYMHTPEGARLVWSTRPGWDQQSEATPEPSPAAEQPVDATGIRAVTTFSLNTTQFELTIERGSDFGSPLGFRRIVWAAELLSGLLLFALLLATGSRTVRRERDRVRREALLGAALEGSPGWTAIVDEYDRVVMANRGEHGVGAGGKLDEVEVWAQDTEATATITRLVAAARLGTAGNLQHVWSDPTDASHAMRIFEVDVRPLPDHTLVYVQCIDVTEHRDRAMRTAQSERMEAIGVLAGGLAHDFNNLLFITLGYLQMLQRQPLIHDDRQASTYVSRAIEAVDRGAVVAKSLLSFARSQPLTAVPLNLREFLENLAPLVEQGLGPAHTLTTTIAIGQSLDVVVDPGRLSSSLLNIVFNARDAMEHPGRLEISVTHASAARSMDDEPEETVAITVRDTGKGIPPEVLARAFEPFFTTKKVGSGTGLGLSTVYSFAQQSGGWAAIESTEGVGTAVTIYLPAALGATPAALTKPASLHGATRALVVDDEPALADLVAGWLESFGMQTKVANSPRAALQVAQEFRPQLLISDANLADPVDGLELARVLVQRDPALLVVFMTGFSDRIKALQRAGVATLAKPFSSDDLYSILTTHLGERLADSSLHGGHT